MAKLTTSDLANLQNESSAVSTINANFALVETAMENTLSRDGTSPNTMSADLDMNSNAILNLPAPTTDAEPARKAELDALEASVQLAALNTAVDEAEAAQAAAEASATAAAASAAEAEIFADNFDDVYLGAKASNPTLDNDGDALVEGQLYWNTTSDALRIYDGANWQSYNPLSGAPDDATYIVATANGALTSERVVTNNSDIEWDVGTASQLKATIANDAVTYAKMQNVSATDMVLGRSTSGAGNVEEIPCTATGRSIIAGASTAAVRATLDLEVGTDVLAYDAQLFSNIPQNSQSAAYTLVATDAQKHILHPTADNNARTFTIPANASVAYPIGTAITFINQINTVTIAITSDTLTLAGAGTTGSRTLAANGIATAIKIGTTSWIISGTGLT